MGETAEGRQLRPDLRAELERIAEELGLGVGETELILRFDRGRLRWYTMAHLRLPASGLDTSREEEHE